MVKIYNNIIQECLKELSDKSYQERVWTASSGPEISSFAEAVTQLYGGTGLHFAYENGDPVYGEQIDPMLKELRTVTGSMFPTGPARKLIESEKMAQVRKTAANILALIEQQKANETNE